MSLYAIFCRHMQGLTHNNRLLVAYSGGLDSTVLLALAARFASEQGITIKALHIAHGLQAAAEPWPAHCIEVAAALGVPCDVHEVQIALGPRVSVEAAAREARYRAFTQAMSEQDILLTGHHLDDQAETLLLALKRGAGISGLAAMPARKSLSAEGHKPHWRPLLSCSRRELENYAQQHRLNWVEDPSNTDDKFDRNFLRNQILPRLLSQWPSFNDTVARSAELCAEQGQLALELAEIDLALLQNPQGGISVAGLTKLSVARRHNVLRHWLQRQGVHPSRVQLHTIWQEVALARLDASPEVRLGERRVCRYQDALYVQGQSVQPQALTELKTGLWLETGVGQLRITWVEQQPDLCGALTISQLSLHFNLTGLRAQPNGRAGSRALKKLWQEYAIAPWLRSQMPLLMDANQPEGGAQLVAVPGLFISQAYAPQAHQAGWRLEWQPKLEAESWKISD